jgi:hypothetical protein
MPASSIELGGLDVPRTAEPGFTVGTADDLISLGGGSEFSSRLPYRTAKERVKLMTDIVIEAEEELLKYEVSDEALEATASSEEAAYTLGACTGLSVCPG